MSFKLDIQGLKELQNAVRRNPERVRIEAGKFLVRGIAIYNRIILRNPWRMGMGGGGAPVDTGNLRDTHRREISTWRARIFPTAPYAPFVHGIEGFTRRRSYQLRPWLDFAQERGDKEIRQLEKEMLQSIVSDLAQ